MKAVKSISVCLTSSYGDSSSACRDIITSNFRRKVIPYKGQWKDNSGLGFVTFLASGELRTSVG